MTTDVALMMYSLGGGGVERMRLHLAAALHKRGYTAAIVVARAQGPYRDSLPSGVRLVDLAAYSWKAWLGSLTAYLKNERPTVLLAAMETAGIIALWARRRAGVETRIVVSSHIEISRHILSERKRLKRILVPHLVRRLYGTADGLIAVSNGVADNLAFFARLPRDRVRVIYNPVVTDCLVQTAEEEIDHPWLADSTVPLIIAVGRLTKQKDFGTLLRAFAVVRRQRMARLMILGEGEDKGVLETSVYQLGLEKCTHMPGFRPNPAGYIARSSVLVLSSAWEGFGNVLVEALACGCPVVSTDCPSGPREILADGKYGRLVRVGDHQALARAILETLDNPPDPNILKARAMDFHVDKVVDQYVAVMGLR